MGSGHSSDARNSSRPGFVMSYQHERFILIAALLTGAGTAGLVAQSPGGEPASSPPSHQHYVQSALANQPGPNGQLAPRLQNLGTHVFPVSTDRPEAQLYINQGLNLSYAFNHAEAGRSFREAARLDPDLAMAYWGQALVLGPNINAPMNPDDEGPALMLVQEARSRAAAGTPKERALIDALSTRYTGDPAGRRTNDQAYARAMREVHERFPDDLDISMLYVEATMDLRPWQYWTPDGQPYEGIAEIVRLTERVLASNPRHPLALHLYIHLLEPTSAPERAESAADTLLTLMPAAGHIVHMPSHIYQRVGRYADAIHSNELAIEADEDYIAQCRAQGLYPMGYYPHNIHFLWFAATADGQSRKAIEAARKVASKVDDASLGQMFMLAGFRVVPYWALTRFGRWDAMLREPSPPPNPFVQGAWHYARGLAYVGKGKAAAAEVELQALQKVLADDQLDQPLLSPSTARAILAIGPEVLAGEIAASQGQYDRAIAHLTTAVRLEDALVYTEPSEWHYPPRLALGAVLLEAGRPLEAETVYWEDLRRNRENGWALFGLVEALKAQGKTDLAQLAEARFKRAWERADIALSASRFARGAGKS
jgi:tetratricopeptide (TPR) repeat protein